MTFCKEIMDTKLKDQTIVIVGGTSGMGLSIARLSAAEGGSVIIGSRSPEKVASTAEELGVSGRAIDTTTEDSVMEFFSAIGAID